MPTDMNKTIQEASLENLHDIIMPDAVGLFPLSPGWVVILLLLMALLFHFTLQRYKRYKKSQYRREALKELPLYAKEGRVHTIALLSLAKRVGIAAYGRKEVAKLSSNDWWDFMQTHSKAKVNTGLREEIDKLLYDATFTVNIDLHNNIRQCVSLWIKTHRANKDV